ncbi:uncharacterized protein AMSG_04658 [Thecamonas trahens ATCC 50062]|uniref:CBS domain-containing protein n=1 Tax=Thecamonas trahens ATCC 50062 TaxID=461836 RepID=A0A0L0DC79_THETB|nr:hypothetical protein AMSG_04658 [Thecamonas trahens ATCC 50062]KNC48913.1 hypothetical protein AMSG_04658 [Thecamonas trahens ATCC 50062]|eukprot:XP_013758330.1 hypothetical protein AMSG_04658 [Thecamonas trahens ATCC 50062]
MAEDNPVPRFRIPLAALVADKPPVATVLASAPAGTLAQVLDDAGSSFAAVVDSNGHYIDGVSVFDLLARAREGRHRVAEALVDEDTHNAQLAATFAAASVDELVGSYSISGENAEYRISSATLLRATLHLFAAGLHYLLVVAPKYMIRDEASGELPPLPAREARLLEKKDVLAWARAHLTQLASDEQLDADIVTASLFYANVPKVLAETSAGDAIEELYNAKTDGVAIVSPEGFLLGNFSVSDAKVVTAANFKVLSLPILDFLELHGRLREPVFVSKTTSLRAALELFSTHVVSRLWVVDDATRVVGVCSMASLMSLFFRL